MNPKSLQFNKQDKSPKNLGNVINYPTIADLMKEQSVPNDEAKVRKNECESKPEIHFD